MSIARRVRECRYIKGWGPDELANRAAISRTALYQIECGKTETPRAGTLRRIAEALGVPIEVLLGQQEMAFTASPTPAVSTSWTPGEVDAPRLANRMRHARSHSGRDAEIHRKFNELLESDHCDSIIRIIDELHRVVEPEPSQSELA